MALVYTSVSGAPGDSFDHPTVNASRNVLLQDVTPGTALPDGDYIGEPLVWSEGGWQGGSVVHVEQVTAIASDQALAMTGGAAIYAETNAAGIALYADATATTVGFQGSTLRCDAAGCLLQHVDALTFLRITDTQLEAAGGLTMTLSAAGAGVALSASGADLGCGPGQSVRVSVNGVSRVEADDNGVGFLAAAPVPRQSITGATTQDQVDSIVAALVAFGLATDDR